MLPSVDVDVVGAVLACFWKLLEPSWGPLGVPLGALGGFLGARWAFEALVGCFLGLLENPKTLPKPSLDRKL